MDQNFLPQYLSEEPSNLSNEPLEGPDPELWSHQTKLTVYKVVINSSTLNSYDPKITTYTSQSVSYNVIYIIFNITFKMNSSMSHLKYVFMYFTEVEF